MYLLKTVKLHAMDEGQIRSLVDGIVGCFTVEDSVTMDTIIDTNTAALLSRMESLAQKAYDIGFAEAVKNAYEEEEGR